MKKKDKYIIIIFLIIFFAPLLASGITVDEPFYPTLELANADNEVTLYEIIRWIIGILAIVSILGLIVFPILMTIYQKKANQLLDQHHVEPKPEERSIIEREKIILKYNYLFWFRGVGCLLLVIFVFAIQNLTLFIIYLATAIFFFLMSYTSQRKMRLELKKFDDNNPGIKEKMKKNTVKILEVTPEIRPEYERLINLKKLFNRLMVASVIVFVICLLSWAILIFTPGPATEVTA